MPLEDTAGAPRTLRDHLRLATKGEHDRLDASVGALDIAAVDDYRRFLSMQLAARRPVEAWLADRNAPCGPPPSLVPLIEADLRSLGGAVASSPVAFDPPPEADVIGAYWAIAGSSMGNRAMQVRLSRVSPDFPAEFLSDPATVRYWQKLKPLIEAPCEESEAQHAIACARAVFATFVAAAEKFLVDWPSGKAA